MLYRNRCIENVQDGCKTNIALHCNLRDNYSGGYLRVSISFACASQNFCFQNFHFLSLKSMVGKAEVRVTLVCKI